MGNTILEVLRENLTPEPVPRGELITLSSPADRGSGNLTLYLYFIEENNEGRDSRMRDTGQGSLQYPPSSLYLYYLLTAYSEGKLPERAAEEGRILGRAMQVLNDNPILKGPSLQGTLAEKDEPLKLKQLSLSLEELHRVWNFPDLAYKLSVAYKVGPVNLDSTRTRTVKRVREVSIDFEQRLE